MRKARLLQSRHDPPVHAPRLERARFFFFSPFLASAELGSMALAGRRAWGPTGISGGHAVVGMAWAGRKTRSQIKIFCSLDSVTTVDEEPGGYWSISPAPAWIPEHACCRTERAIAAWQAGWSAGEVQDERSASALQNLICR